MLLPLVYGSGCFMSTPTFNDIDSKERLVLGSVLVGSRPMILLSFIGASRPFWISESVVCLAVECRPKT